MNPTVCKLLGFKKQHPNACQMLGVVRTRQLACKEQVQALLDLNRTEEQNEDRTDHKNVLNDTEFQTPQEGCLHSTLEKPCDDDRTSEYEVSVIQ